MRINHNISALTTQGSLFKANRGLGKSIEKLSTGLRINTAADDAAGLGVSENLRTQVRGLNQALKNTQDSISLLNIADGALEEQAAILQRMRELIIQAKNDTYTDTERGYMYEEFSALMEELDRIAEVTNFNGLQLFATPEASGLSSNRLYDQNYKDGFDNNGFQTSHALNRAYQIWGTDSSKYLFGEDDVSSANHFNMMIGANYSSNDADAFNSTYNSFTNQSADNLVTIQFGQMDAHALLTIYPGANFFGMGDADELWDSFEMDITTPDMEDFSMWAFSTGNSVNTAGEKLNLLLKIIDGDGAEWDQGLIDTFGTPNNIPPGTVRATNVTGLERVNRMRASIGAWINRLEHAASNSMNQMENQQAAESLIRDVDFATETTQFTRNKILSEASTAMLAQANMRPASVLGLVK